MWQQKNDTGHSGNVWQPSWEIKDKNGDVTYLTYKQSTLYFAAIYCCNFNSCTLSLECMRLYRKYLFVHLKLDRVEKNRGLWIKIDKSNPAVDSSYFRIKGSASILSLMWSGNIADITPERQYRHWHRSLSALTKWCEYMMHFIEPLC